MNKGEHLTERGLQEIVNIRACLNLGSLRLPLY